MRILLPVDGSEHCRNALRFIASRQALSPEKEATVELLNVQHSIPEAVINALGLDSVRKASQDEGMKVIDAMRAVGDVMPTALRETGGGGLAASSRPSSSARPTTWTPTSSSWAAAASPPWKASSWAASPPR